MHDPMTLVCDVPQFWTPSFWRWIFTGRNKTHRLGRKWISVPSLALIWHVDPEADGTDNSCGWPFVKLNEEQLAKCKQIAGEMRDGHPYTNYFIPVAHGGYACKYGVFETVYAAAALCNRVIFRRQELTQNQLQWVFRLSTNTFDSFQQTLRDNIHDRQEIDRFIWAVARGMATELRPWYKHPRWHLHHWRIQVQPVQHLKRWLFSRCCRCGKGFKWGESVVASGWDSPGPRWFRGEKGVSHGDCRRPGNPCVAEAKDAGYTPTHT